MGGTSRRGWMIPLLGVPVLLLIALWVYSLRAPRGASVQAQTPPPSPSPSPAPPASARTPPPPPAWVVDLLSPEATDAPAPDAGPDAGCVLSTSALMAALKAVAYKHCGTGGPGKVTITFEPTGSVSGVYVSAGDYDAAAKSCVAGQFRSARVSPFCGGPRSVSWSISL